MPLSQAIGLPCAAASWEEHILKHKIFLQTLILMGCIAFAITVLWVKGWLGHVFISDQSGLSMAIAAIFLITSLHWLHVSWLLSSDRLAFDSHGSYVSQTDVGRLLAAGEVITPRRLDALVERIHNRHMVGHFVADTLMKLGLLGTIVGFILMLLPVGDIEDFDVSVIRTLMISMSEGMGIALYTTLAGLVTSTLVKLQYLLLDKAAGDLVSDLEDQTEVFEK